MMIVFSRQTKFFLLPWMRLGVVTIALAWAGCFIPAQSKAVTVVIDPGHGGDDSGVRGPSGTFEKDSTLLLATGLKKMLEEDQSLRVLLTRDEDRRVSELERATIANRAAASVYVSLHCAHSQLPSAAGFGLFYYQPDSRQTSEFHSIKETIAGKEIQLVPWTLAQLPWAPASQDLAELILQKLRPQAKPAIATAVGLKLKPLAEVNCPAVLIEIAVLSNPDDEKLLADESYRAGFDRKVKEAILEFLKAKR